MGGGKNADFMDFYCILSYNPFIICSSYSFHISILLYTHKIILLMKGLNIMDNQFNSDQTNPNNVSNNTVEFKYNDNLNSQNHNYNYQPNSSYYNQYTQKSSNRNSFGNAQVVSENSIENKNSNNKKKMAGWLKAVIAVSVCTFFIIGIVSGFALGRLFNYKNSVGTVNENSSLNNDSSHSQISEKSDFLTYAIENADTQALSTPEIAEKCCPSVVEIVTEIATYGGWFGNSVQSGAGSGVVLTEDGYIVTNHHVIEGASKITVTVDDEHTYDAKIIGSDENADIALIKVEAKGLVPATVGDSDNMVVGEKTIVIGNPLGQLGDTVTDGIVSALNREVKIDGRTSTLFQTNAAINPGNSGGGVFNAAGNLIGIVDAKSSGADIEGLGFAIPVNTMSKVVKEIMEYGYVKGYVDTGIEFVEINDYFTAMQYRVNQFGVYVLKVNSDLALNAGFQSGDLIKKVDGSDISTISDIEKVLKNHKVGDKVDFIIDRPNSQSLKITLELGEYVPSTLTSSAK